MKRYPLFDNEIDQIQVRSGNTVSVGALATCAFWNIDVLVMTGRGAPVAILRALDDDSHVATRVAQYRSLENGKFEGIAKGFVIGKIEGQNKILAKFGLKPIDSSIVEKVKALKSEEPIVLRRKLTGLEGKASEGYFEQVFSLFDDSIRPRRRRTFKAYDGLNNLFNLGYRVVSWKIHVALLEAKLEPYLGYLHGLQFGKPSLICDFLELYRYLVDGFIIGFAKRIGSKDFVINDEVYSSNRRGKRQYLDERLTDEFLRGINAYFRSKVSVPRIRNGKEQEIETLVGEEALLLAKYLRDEMSCWAPRVVNLG